MSATIPQPPPTFLLGNVRDIDTDYPIGSLVHLAATYGEIYQVVLLGQRQIVVSSQKIVAEICNDIKGWDKTLGSGLLEIRNSLGVGLFTSYTEEHDWELAHRILMPGFSGPAMRDMFDMMVDIATQCFERWDKFGQAQVIDLADNMTRLTLDTIALCSMGYRFNSFYREGQHEFVNAMVGVLHEAGQRSQRPGIANRIMFRKATQYQHDIDTMHNLSSEILADRKAHPTDSPDLLNRMLSTKDPVTGEKLPELNCLRQMITFLVAGHETTSGLLTFTLLLLLQNPETLHKAQEEVDRVVGQHMLKFEHLKDLLYVEAALKEALRLHPTAPAFTMHPKEGEKVLDGQYTVTSKDTVIVLLEALHRDPEIWGASADRFDPERMMPDKYAALPNHAYKPFGNGVRACIGVGELYLDILTDAFSVHLLCRKPLLS